MYGYHADQNPEEGIYSWSFEAGHRTFVNNGKWPNLRQGKCKYLEIISLDQKICPNKFMFNQIMQYITLIGSLGKIHIFKNYPVNIWFSDVFYYNGAPL